MKKSKKTIIAFVITIVILASASVVVVCCGMGVFDKNNPDTWFEDAKNGGIDVEKTEAIKVGMTFGEIVDILGKPQRDTGSGVWIMEWDLKSGGVFAVSFNAAASTGSEAATATKTPNLDLISFYTEIRNK